MADGTWSYIPVCEGFLQGCPISSVFAAIVLKEILSKVERDLCERAENRKLAHQPLDDARGGVPIIMAYVNDVNALIPLDDVEFFLERFQLYGTPLGAIMNTEKT